MQVCEHQLIVIAATQQIVRRWRKADTAHVLRVWSEALHISASPDVVEGARGVLMPTDKKPPAGIYTQAGNGAAVTSARSAHLSDGRDHVDTAASTQVPEANRLIVRPAYEHCT